MKNNILLTGLFFVIILSSSIIAADVAYVVEDSHKVDLMTWTALEDMDLEIEIITNDMIMNTDLTEYSFILIGAGKLKNVMYIPEMPMILTNSRYATHFNFLEKGRTKRFGANSNLMAKVLGENMEIYDMPSNKIGGPALTYEYLPMKFMNENLMNYASTTSDKTNKMGSIIAFNEEEDTCWFGISNTHFWNINSKLLFSDCIKTALDMNVIESHNIAIKEDHTDSVNGLRLKNTNTGIALLDEISELECGETYKVDYVTENLGDFTEDIEFMGELEDFTWTATKTGLAPGATTTTGSKTFTIDNTTFSNGIHSLDVTAEIAFDVDLNDNFRSRFIEIINC